MKFRFCGDQDCPDWFLTQMATLSRLSSVKAKLLAQHVGRRLISPPASVYSPEDDAKVESLLSDSKLTAMERRSLVASLQFLLESASRFGLSDEEEHLRAELQQLGLPKEHAGALARVHTEAGPSIRRRLLDSSLMVNRLVGVEWRHHKGNHPKTNVVVIQLDLEIASSSSSAGNEMLSLTADPGKLQTLLYELERIRDIMEQKGF